MNTKAIIAGALLVPMLIGTSFAAKTELESALSLSAKGVINSGSSAADFGLSQTITRKEMMKVVLNLSGKNVPDTCNGTFSDVSNDWGCKYIEAGLANGLIAANATFRPDATISKAEAMKLVLGARGIEKAYTTADWQADWMNTALDNGLITGAYSDHNSSALRGWIFGVGAAELGASPTVQADSTVVVQDEVKETPVVQQATTGYVDYDQSLLGQNETTVLFFHASWCPSCRAADSNISASGVDDILLLKTDYDSSTDLRKKYGVTTQHTFVQVDADGELIKKWNGSNTIEDIVEKAQ